MKEETLSGKEECKPEKTENTANVTENETNKQEEKDSKEAQQSESDKLAEELSAMKDSHLRLMAEYDNYRKRTRKEKIELIKNGGEKVLEELLPIVDDFERAIKNMDENLENGKEITEGIKLIHDKFIAFLNRNGVKTLETEGKKFDAEFHEAIATVPAREGQEKGLIVDCVQTGYLLDDKVIRHAKVVVVG